MMRRHVRGIAFVALLLPALLVGLVAVPRVLNAAPVTRHVTSCNAAGGGSLADIVATVAQSGDTIVFDQNCTIAVSATINIPSTKDLTIDALTGNRTVMLDGGGTTQILHLQATNNHGPSVTLNGLTLQNGKAAQGGAIFNDQGTLTITNSAIVNNTATTGGGGIENAGGKLNVTNSTFSGNKVTGTTQATGGAIENDSSGTLVIVASTISGNSVTSGGSQSSSGGGIFDFSVAANSVKLTNTLVAGNTTGNCNGADIGSGNPTGVASGGHNLIGIKHNNPSDAACGVDFTALANGSGELVGTDAAPINGKLGALTNNGGTTPTLAPLFGSPVIDAGSCSGVPATDQRGVARPVNGTCDIGAVESQGFTVQSVAVAVAAGGSTTIKIGETVQLKATATYNDGSVVEVTGQVQWSSENAGVATVNATGLVMGVTPGPATITATSGSVKGQTAITVSSATFTGITPPQQRPTGAGAGTAVPAPPPPEPPRTGTGNAPAAPPTPPPSR